MSTPRSLRRAVGVRALTLDLPAGPVAALRAEPDGGSDPDRAAVLLVPGFTGGKEDFLDLLPELAARGFTAVGFDQRGQYETAGPEHDDPEAYSLEAFAADLLAVADAVGGGPVHLVGHSFGGLVAQTAAVERPAAFRSLTLLGTGPGALPAAQHADLQLLVAGLPVVGKDAAWTVLRERAVAARGPADDEVEAFVRRRFVTTTAGSLIAMARLLTSAPDLVDAVGVTGLPVHVLHGESDDAWPPELQRAVAQRLTARYGVIPATGHSPNVDDPAATAEMLTAFFSSVESAPTDLRP